MATEKQITDGGSGGKVKTPAGKPTAEAGDDEGDMYNSSDEVPLTEEFQKHVHKMVGKSNKHHLMHLRNAINAREDKLRAEEKPDEYSDKDMPSAN